MRRASSRIWVVVVLSWILPVVMACRHPTPRATSVGERDLLAEAGSPDEARPASLKRYRRWLAHANQSLLSLDLSDPKEVGRWSPKGANRNVFMRDGSLVTTSTMEGALFRKMRSFPMEGDRVVRLTMRSSAGGNAMLLLREANSHRFRSGWSGRFRLETGSWRTYRTVLQRGAGRRAIFSAKQPASERSDGIRLAIPAGRVEIRRVELLAEPTRAEKMLARLRFQVADRVVLGGISRPVARVGRAEFRLIVPRSAALMAQIGIVPRGRKIVPHRFRAVFESAGSGRTILFDRLLAPATSEPRWQPVDVSLASVAGRRGRLLLESVAVHGGEEVWVGGVWADPVLTGEMKLPGTRRPLNVLLISIDTLRADRFGCYGNDRPLTPYMDRLLARRGVQIAEGHAPAPWTLPSHWSLFTGFDPIAHGVQTGHERLAMRFEPLADSLWKRGYQTYAITAGAYVRSEWGFDRGFARFQVIVNIEVAVRAVSRKLESLSCRPFFFFFHTAEPHAKYLRREPQFSLLRSDDLPAGLRNSSRELQAINRSGRAPGPIELSAYRDLYDSGVAYTDHAIARLLLSLRPAGFAKNTLVVLVSDHGEEFYEHGKMEHGWGLYEELLQVPIFFRLDGLIPRRLLAGPVSLLDVTPTILDLVGSGRSWPPEQGMSMARTLRGAGFPGMNRSLFAAVKKPSYGDPKYSLLRDNRKLVFHPDSGSTEFYDLKSNPRESRRIDIASEETRRLASELASRLGREGEHQVPKARELSRETTDQLRELGYLP